jgi:hypothetical protein
MPKRKPVADPKSNAWQFTITLDDSQLSALLYRILWDKLSDSYKMSDFKFSHVGDELVVSYPGPDITKVSKIVYNGIELKRE